MVQSGHGVRPGRNERKPRLQSLRTLVTDYFSHSMILFWRLVKEGEEREEEEEEEGGGGV